MAMAEVVKMANGKLRGYGQENDKAYKKFRRWVKKLEPGEFFTLSWRRERNPAHHRKLMALVTYVAENSDVYDNKAKALDAVKLAAGHCDWIQDPKGGGLVPIPKSISFDNLDQDAFEEFYANAIQGVITHILPHMTRVDMNEALQHVSEF